MAFEFSLENVLAIVIALITVNLLFIGFYIVSVLREVKKTVHRAGVVIDEVDKTVKDGLEKAKAMNAPLQALATTATAFGGIMKTGDVIRKATQSILGGGGSEQPAVVVNGDSKTTAVVEVKMEEPKIKSVKITDKPLAIKNEKKSEDYDVPEINIEADKKRVYRKPRFFKKR